MLRILPHRFHDDKGQLAVDGAKHLEPSFLAVNEAMLFRRVKIVSPPNGVALALDCGRKCFLDLLLRGPAFAVR